MTPRTYSDLPILMLTARGEPMTGSSAFRADDYSKPFELPNCWPARAVLRRSTPRGADILRFGRLEIDGARGWRLDGEERAITSYQFALLLVLAERAGRVLSPMR